MDYKFDYQAAVQQFKDMVVIDFMTSLAQDDKTKRIIGEAMSIFVKNGIPADIAIKIIIEIGNILNKEENE
jgi:hypothetical protein|nr:MAG TPA: hypothetical protein [Caudoviricetes sp.]